MADLGKKRLGVQLSAALLQNAHFRGFFTGRIYQGELKGLCVPGLNCYSCPGAVGACPLGTLQGVLARQPFRLPYYVLGALLFFGALLGRAVCGFLCPVGLFQDLLFRIPFFKKVDRWRGDRILRLFKYVLLFTLVLLLPLAAGLAPLFCKYVCPGGTLAGILLALSDVALRPLLGGIFVWKVCVLLAICLAGLALWRPFCRYLCPLGALYGFFNKVSLFRLRLDKDACVSCSKCAGVCRMGLDPVKKPNSSECVRCGDCVGVCPTGALRMGFPKKSPKGE